MDEKNLMPGSFNGEWVQGEFIEVQVLSVSPLPGNVNLWADLPLEDEVLQNNLPPGDLLHLSPGDETRLCLDLPPGDVTFLANPPPDDASLFRINLPSGNVVLRVKQAPARDVLLWENLPAGDVFLQANLPPGNVVCSKLNDPEFMITIEKSRKIRPIQGQEIGRVEQCVQDMVSRASR